MRKYVSQAQAHGLYRPLPEGPDDSGLEALLSLPRAASTRYVEPDHAWLPTELRHKGVTLQLLWSEYAAAAGAGVPLQPLLRALPPRVKRQRRSLRLVPRAGAKLFIDCCGPTEPVVDA